MTERATSEAATAEPPPLPLVWRAQRTRVVALSTAGVACCGAVVIAAALPSTWGIPDRVGIALIGAAIAAVLLLLARPAVRADADVVTVVNLVSRRRLQWSEIVRVGIGRDDPWVMLDLADGSTLPVMALSASEGKRGRRRAQQLAALVTSRSAPRR